jgi:hypothetical protein
MISGREFRDLLSPLLLYVPSEDIDVKDMAYYMAW